MFLLNGLGQKVRRSLGLEDTSDQPSRPYLARDKSSYNQQFFNTTLAEAAPYLPQQQNSTQGLLPEAKPNIPHAPTLPNSIGNGSSDSTSNANTDIVNRSDNSAMIMRNMNGMSVPGQSIASHSGLINPRTRETLDTAIVLSQKSTLISAAGPVASTQGNEQNAAITVAASPSLPIVSPEIAEIAEVALRQAEIFIKQKSWEKAVKACDRALSIDPTLAKAHKLMGNVLQYMGNPVESISCYVEALVLNPKYPEVYANLGTVYSSLEDWEQAFSYYQKAVELNPEFEGAYRHLVKAWKQLGRPEEHISTVQKAATVVPQIFTPEEHCQMGNRFLKQGKEQEAIVCFNQALAQQGDYTAAHQALAQILEKQGNWEQAVNHYTKVLDTSDQSPPKQMQGPKTLPTENQSLAKGASNQTGDNEALTVSIDSLTSLARSYVQHDNLEKALTHYKNALRLDPNAADVYQELAEVLTQAGQLEQAVESWYRVVMLQATWATPTRCVEVGNKLLAQKSPSKAIDCYRQALKLDPQCTPAQSQLNTVLNSFSQSQDETITPNPNAVTAQAGGALPKKSEDALTASQSDTIMAMEAHKRGEEFTKKKHWDEAINAYQQAIKLNPKFSWSYHNLANALQKCERWEEAVIEYQEAIALHPNFVWSHVSLGDVLAKLGLDMEAEAAYQAASEVDLECEEAHSKLIDLKLRLGQFSEAIHYAEDLLSRNPKGQLELYLLGNALTKVNQFTGAAECFQAILENYPDSHKGYEGLAILNEALGKLSTASTFWMKCFEQYPNHPMRAPKASLMSQPFQESGNETALFPELNDEKFVEFIVAIIFRTKVSIEWKEILLSNLSQGCSRNSLVHNLLLDQRLKDDAEKVIKSDRDSVYYLVGDPQPRNVEDWYRAFTRNIQNSHQPNTLMTLDASLSTKHNEKRICEVHDFPLVSIITSLYQGDDFIDSFMENICGQSIFESSCELIIIDADSPGSEATYIQKYISKFPKNIRYIRSTERISIYEAWNQAIKIAQGKFLTNANLDDIRRADSLELQAQELILRSDVDVVYSDYAYTLEPNLPFELVCLEGHTTSLPIASFDNLLIFNSPHCAPMWRKKLHDELGFFDLSYKSAGDMDFWLRVSEAGHKFGKIEDTLVAYYHNPTGLSTSPDGPGKSEGIYVIQKYQERSHKRSA